ncbi:WD40-repeat-containing domain protein [Spinellus fusiger]|nr:WD40-repeat-containing domain protein [Spinellus fusiger]
METPDTPQGPSEFNCMSVPEPIVLSDHVFDFSFSPNAPLVAAGLINGHIHCYQYGTEGNNLLWSTQLSKKSCRAVEFNEDGSTLMTISRDKSIQEVNTETGRLLLKIPKAHRYPINKMCLLEPMLVATGDDEGFVKVWDRRVQKAVQEYKAHEDFIADMIYSSQGPSLVVAGGDGRLSIRDMRKPTQPKATTLVLEDELLSLSLVKDGQQVIAGSQSGALYLWQWGDWEKKADQWIGHPCSVDTQCKLDESAICTGGSDGILRLMSVSPHHFEGVLGDHGQDFPVERVRMTSEQYYLGSCGHDLQLRFWDVRFLFDDKKKHKRKGDALGLMKRHKRNKFFQDIEL